MAIVQSTVRPSSVERHRTTSGARRAGFLLAVLGFLLAAVTLIANIVAGLDASVRGSTLPWSFGLTTTAFTTIKLGIAVILWGILMKIWVRVDAIKEGLSRLVNVDQENPIRSGVIDTDYGKVSVSESPPGELRIHRMAKRMWAPMLVMGVAAVLAGLLISLSWASEGGTVTAAWTQGVQFLGEGLILAGIAFLLGTILWAIRTGGGEVQAGLGVAVKTPVMPTTAKVFVGLMMLGLAVAIAQFVLYLVVAYGTVQVPSWFAFLGPLRELGLGLILAGITLALVAIGNVLRYQFARIIELIETGK